MDKRGQAFLIIALIVVAILIGFSMTYTQTKSTKEETKVVDLSDEIYYEGAKVIDYGTFHNNPGQSTEANVENLIANYSNLNPDSQIIFLYGDSKSISNGIIYACKEDVVSGIDVAQVSSCKPVQNTISQSNITIEGNNVKLILGGGEEYNFQLEPTNQNFFVVIKKQTAGGEQVVV